MSIFSIAEESQKLLSVRGVSVAICTAISFPRLLRYTKFDNDHDVLAFADLLLRFPRGSDVLVHIPDLWVEAFGSHLQSACQSRPDIKWRLNILLQNIDMIPPKGAISAIKLIGPATATAAHMSYATTEVARQLGCPVHFLSWRLSSEQFLQTGYASKKKIIVISSDPDPTKAEILRRLSEALPDHKIIEVRKMTYKRYRALIQDAKFGFTFGEGLDAYFIEPIFCGGVGMAIFNDRFFTPEYRDLEGIFGREDPASEVTGFIRAADSEANYQAIAERQRKFLTRTFNSNEYVKHIREFYSTYLPEWSS